MYIEIDSSLDVERYIPRRVYKKVWDDNNAFLNERQLNSSDFFDFFKTLMQDEKIENLVEQNERELMHEIYFILKKMIFDLLVYSSNNNTLKDLTDKFRQLLEGDEMCAHDFGEVIVQNDCSEMIRILLKCPDVTVRQSVSLILATGINKLFSQEANVLNSFDVLENGNMIANSKAERFMLHMIEAINSQAPNNWTKFEEFFRLIFRVAIGGESQLQFFVKHKMISTLGDFFLGPSSPIKDPNEKRQTFGN